MYSGEIDNLIINYIFSAIEPEQPEPLAVQPHQYLRTAVESHAIPPQPVGRGDDDRLAAVVPHKLVTQQLQSTSRSKFYMSNTGRNTIECRRSRNEDLIGPDHEMKADHEMKIWSV